MKYPALPPCWRIAVIATATDFGLIITHWQGQRFVGMGSRYGLRCPSALCVLGLGAF